MSERNTVVRSMHDVGLAAWFGGSLMGAVGLNGAAAQASKPQERLTLSSAGWARWAPVQLAAIAAHGIGGLGLIGGNKGRLMKQQSAQTNTGAKAALTVAALATTAYSGMLGAKMAKHADEGSETVTEPKPTASKKLRRAQQRQKFFQWITPALTGTLIVLAAQQGEQQRPLAGIAKSMKRK